MRNIYRCILPALGLFLLPALLWAAPPDKSYSPGLWESYPAHAEQWQSAALKVAALSAETLKTYEKGLESGADQLTGAALAGLSVTVEPRPGHTMCGFTSGKAAQVSGLYTGSRVTYGGFLSG